jgi:hypothetical protein
MRHVEAGDHHAHLLRMCHDSEHSRQAFHAPHQRTIREIIKREKIRRVLLGNNQEMPRVDGTLVQEREGLLVLINSINWPLSTQQLAERAILD